MKKTLTIHDAKKELPKESGYVLTFNCYYNGGVYHSALLNYSKNYQMFNVHDHNTPTEAKQYALTCDFWAYPPTFEKEMQERKVDYSGTFF